MVVPFMVFATLINCKKEDTSKSLPLSTSVKQDITESPEQKKQDKSPIETVKKFLFWYEANEEKIDRFNTIKGGGMGKTEDTDNYYVDFDEVEKELKLLKETNLFSSKFLKVYKNRYADGNEYFKQNPANDGPPVNFDYNYFFLTQEDFQSDLKNIDHIKFTVKPLSDQLCYVEFHLERCGMMLRYVLTKKDQWMIDSIENIS